MIRKNLILFLLVTSLMLPMGLAFGTVLSREILDDDKLVSMPFGFPEEEHKEDSKPFEKEKDEEKEKQLIIIGLAFTPFIITSENKIYQHNHSKPLNGNSELPFNPPELI